MGRGVYLSVAFILIRGRSCQSTLLQATSPWCCRQTTTCLLSKYRQTLSQRLSSGRDRANLLHQPMLSILGHACAVISLLILISAVNETTAVSNTDSSITYRYIWEETYMYLCHYGNDTYVHVHVFFHYKVSVTQCTHMYMYCFGFSSRYPKVHVSAAPQLKPKTPCPASFSFGHGIPRIHITLHHSNSVIGLACTVGCKGHESCIGVTPGLLFIHEGALT